MRVGWSTASVNDAIILDQWRRQDFVSGGSGAQVWRREKTENVVTPQAATPEYALLCGPPP